MISFKMSWTTSTDCRETSAHDFDRNNIASIDAVSLFDGVTHLYGYQEIGLNWHWCICRLLLYNYTSQFTYQLVIFWTGPASVEQSHYFYTPVKILTERIVSGIRLSVLNMSHRNLRTNYLNFLKPKIVVSYDGQTLRVLLGENQNKTSRVTGLFNSNRGCVFSHVAPYLKR